MNLIIFGPPGSGKGTYSSRFAPKLDILKISTGDILREMAEEDTDLGRRITEIMDKGQFVSDDMIMEIVKERISRPDAQNGFVLDGVPRTIPQAEVLDKMTKIDAIINILAPEEILLEKISARRICKKPGCDGNYNIADIRKTIDGIDYILPPLLPKNDNVCDKCGSELYQRDDDKPEVIKERLKVYEEQAKPVIEYYKNQGKVPFINVHMKSPPDEIVEKILGELKKIGLE